jgi:hypothetical protein
MNRYIIAARSVCFGLLLEVSLYAPCARHRRRVNIFGDYPLRNMSTHTVLTPRARLFHHDPFRQILLMSWFSSTDLGAPRLATFSIARPTHSVVVTYFGKSGFHNG